jgi:uncharacterized membrane protein
MINSNKIVFIPLLTLTGILAGISIYQNFYLIRAIDLMYYSLRLNSPLPFTSILFYFVIPVAALVMVAGVIIEKHYAANGGDTRAITKAILPFMLYGGVAFLPLGFYTPLVFCFICGITAFRLAILLLPGLKFKRLIKTRIAVLISILLAVMAVYCGVYFQIKGHNSFFLHYMDWGYYINCFKNGADGRGLLSVWGYSLFGAHLMPTVAVIMVPFVWLFRSFTAVFILNSMIIYSGALLLWLLNKRFRIPPYAILVLAFCYVINPSVSNLNLTLYYGFNPVYFFIPLFFIFFYLFTGKKIIASGLMYCAIIMVKETVAVFWTGFGAVMLVKRKFKLGLVLIAASISYWVVATTIIMPWFHPRQGYEQTFHYRNFGNSTGEIIHAIIYNPWLFIGKLLEYQNIYFICLLILPLFMLVLSNPVLLFADVIVIVFVCLQDGREVQNILLQYQTEMLALMFINCVVCIHQIRQRGYNLWFNFFAAGIPKSSRAILTASCLISIMTSSMLGYFFFGKTLYGGKCSFEPIAGLPDFTPLVEKIEIMLPAETSTIMTPHLAAHFFLRNDVGMIYSALNSEYVLLDLSDNSESMITLEKLRKQLIASKEYAPLFYTNWLGHQIVLYKKQVNGNVPPEFIKTFSLTEWQKCGMPMKIPQNDFECRVMPDKEWTKVYFFIKPAQKIDYDADIDIILNSGNKKWYLNVVFGHGIYPAYLLKNDQVFVLPVPLPAGWKSLDSASIKISRRKYSDI